MTVHFASNEDIDFVMTGDAVITTTAGYRNTAYCRNALHVKTGMHKALLPTPLTTLYFTADFHRKTPTSGNDHLITVYEGGTSVVRVKCNSGGWIFQVNDSGWVQRGSAWTAHPPATTLTRVTIKVILHATNGELSGWVNDTLAFSWTGDTIGSTGATGLDALGVSGGWNASTAEARWSQIVIADEQTINMRVATLAPNGDGTNTAWVNGYAAVDEVSVSDGDTISSDTADEKETMNCAAYGGGGSLVVRGVFVSARALRGAAGPQNLQLAVREGTTEGFSASKALDTVYATYRENFEINPDTGVAFTIAELADLQTGVKSIT